MHEAIQQSKCRDRTRILATGLLAGGLALASAAIGAVGTASASAPGAKIQLSSGAHRVSATLPRGWKVSKASAANAVTVAHGNMVIFMTIGKASSSDVATDLVSDRAALKAAGARFAAVRLHSLSGQLNSEAYSGYEMPKSNHVGLVDELLDTNSSDNYSAFFDAHPVSSRQVKQFVTAENEIVHSISDGSTGTS